MRKELRIVASTARSGAAAPLVDQLAGAAGRLDPLASGLREAGGAARELLGELAVAEHLDRDPPAGGEAGGLHRGGIDRRAVVEARIQVVEVDGLGVRPERLERHRHLLVRPAQLAHPHVDRVLAALEARAGLGAGTRAVALVAAPGRLAVAGAMAAPDALAGLARARRRLETVEADGLGVDGRFLGHADQFPAPRALRDATVCVIRILGFIASA